MAIPTLIWRFYTMYRWLLICHLLYAAMANKAAAQCVTGGALWLNGQNNGMMRDTGLIGGLVTVSSGTVGTMVSGRPLYQTGSSTWKGRNYAALQVWRAYSSIGSNYTYFKLSSALDSGFIHIRVDNIRGDFFNWETQAVRGYLNGVQVAADFKDPVNGAYNTGNSIHGATSTNSTTQSAMRVFFHSAVDSIVVQQVSVSDWIIAELMMECNVLLPAALQRWDARRTANGILLNWKNVSEQGLRSYILEKSTDGIHFTDLRREDIVTRNALYNYFDASPSRGSHYYRLKMIYLSGLEEYSGILMVRWNTSNQEITVHPNPARNHFTISSLPLDASGAVFSQDGKLMYRFNTGGAKNIDCSGWPRGQYVIRVNSAGAGRSFKLIRY